MLRYDAENHATTSTPTVVSATAGHLQGDGAQNAGNRMKNMTAMKCTNKRGEGKHPHLPSQKLRILERAHIKFQLGCIWTFAVYLLRANVALFANIASDQESAIQIEEEDFLFYDGNLSVTSVLKCRQPRHTGVRDH